MARYNDIRTLAESHASEISRSVRAWTGYLDTAAQLYRYNFADTLLIHAQRPDATACAELETWNNKMGRWVNRGSKGIALIDDSGPRKRLRYVFDISDTHMVRGGLDPMVELTADDFSGLQNFNRLSVLSFLGNAAHDIAEPVLKDIGREVIFRYRALAAERKIDEYLQQKGFSVENEKGVAYNEFHTLIRESVNEGQQEEHNTQKTYTGGKEDGIDLHEEGRLPVSGPDDRRRAGGDREVRDAAEQVFIPATAQVDPGLTTSQNLYAF